MKRFVGEEGQALVEFSLALVVLVASIFGIIESGRLVYAYVTIGNAAREGTRTAIISGATDTEVRSSIDAHAGLLGRLSPGAMIAPAATRQSGGSVTVTVTYTYRGLTPVAQLFGNVTLTSTSTAVVE
jgi:Flp pilus assembly protein TadG